MPESAALEHVAQSMEKLNEGLAGVNERLDRDRMDRLEWQSQSESQRQSDRRRTIVTFVALAAAVVALMLAVAVLFVAGQARTEPEAARRDALKSQVELARAEIARDEQERGLAPNTARLTSRHALHIPLEAIQQEQTPAQAARTQDIRKRVTDLLSEGQPVVDCER